MNTTEITTALLNGSRNIDKMREEIRQLISMVIGFTLKSLENGERFEGTFTSTDYEYEWTIFLKKGCVSSPEIKCWKKNSGDKPLLEYTSDRRISIYTDNVQAVYESLPLFVEGMMKNFPHITEEWQFLIDASKKFC
jgi:hypothetical protein